MSEEKLDLILTVVSDINGRMGKLENEFGSLKSEVGSLKSEVGSLKSEVGSLKNEFGSFKVEVNARFDSLENELKDFKGVFNEFKGEFKDFKKQVIQSIKSLHTRIDQLESHVLAIGMEVKNEIRHEISVVRKEMSRLENKIMLEQAEKFENKSEQLKQEVAVRELQEKVRNIEINLKLAA